MAASSATFHESVEELAPATLDRHRAIVSLMEELEAVDWYDQRIDASGDAELTAILAHNRDEEKSTRQWFSSGSAAAILCGITISAATCSPTDR